MKTTMTGVTVMTMAAATMLGLGACSAAKSTTSATSSDSGAGARAGQEQEGVIHQRTAEDRRALLSKEPITADRVTLYVDGMGCPLCVTNVDKQLLRLKGVTGVQVDLGAGTVEVTLAGAERPSPARLATAVEDAGNTLAKIAVR